MSAPFTSSKLIKPIQCEPLPFTESSNHPKILQYTKDFHGVMSKISQAGEMLSMFDKMISAEAKKTGNVHSPKKFFERIAPSENDPILLENKNRQLRTACQKKIDALKKTEEYLIESRKTIESPKKKKKIDVKKMLEDSSIAKYL